MSCQYPELGMPLSPRECEVYARLMQGRRIASIRQELGISKVTIDKHLISLYAKLGVADKTQAVMLAWKRGWVR